MSRSTPSTTERPITAVLDRSYRTFDEDRDRAIPLLTPEYAAEFRHLVADLRPQFIRTRTEVRSTVSGSGIASVTGASVEVLVLVEQRTTRPGAAPVKQPYALIATLVDSGGRWLLDALEIGGTASGDEPDPERRAVLDDATTFAQAYLSVDHRTVGSDLDRVESLATGQFLDEFRAARGGLADLVRRNRSVRLGAVAAVGLERFTDSRATVLVAATTKTRVGDDAPSTSTARLRVVMELVSGRWLASSVTPVT